MSSSRKLIRNCILIGGLASLYAAFGLAPTAWGFYELSHALNAPGLYPLYSLFRGADYLIGLRPDAILVYLGFGLVVGCLSYGLGKLLRRTRVNR